MDQDVSRIMSNSSEIGSMLGGFSGTSIAIMLFLSIIGYGYWKYGRSTEQNKYIGVALIMWIFPYISSDPIYMIGVSAASAVIAHFVID